MALISCPECGREVSDQVKSCPHCGYPFGGSDPNQEQPQKVEVTSVNLVPKNPATKKKIIAGLIVAVIAVVCIIAIVIFTKNSKEASARSEYIENLSTARMTMLSGGAEAESLCNLTKSVWANTIHEERDAETDKYTLNAIGLFNDDFNSSLKALYNDSSTTETLSMIEANQEEVEDLMRELQNPPEGLETCYDTLDSLYDAYRGLTDLAISPSGSLNSYSETFGNLDDDFMLYFDKLETQIPEQ